MLTSAAWSAKAGTARDSKGKAGILKRTLQRPMDTLCSGILLLLASPLFLVAALAIWLTDRGSVFFRQTRVGLYGHPFEVLKFRSMRANDLPLDDVTEIREGHPLVTPVGKWLRRYKVDELPQLLNVFRGEMALIGPRPGLPEHIEKYDAFQWRRLNVRPGMTGWAQVNGGIDLTWGQRIMLDIWYVDHRGFGLDVKILARTVAVILFGETIHPDALREATIYAAQEPGVIRTESLLRPVTAGGDHFEDGPVPSIASVPAPVADGGHRPLARVVHLSSAHRVFDPRIFHKECRSLVMAGYDVTAIGLSSEPGMRRDGVKIRGLNPPRSRSERMIRTIWNVYQAALRENAEIYHFHDPELMPVGALLKMRGKRVVYDVHEDVSFGIRYKQWLRPLLRWPVSMAFRVCEMMFVSIFDLVIAVTPSIARKYPAAKTRLVRNFPWSHEFWAVEGLPYEQREPIAVYAGVLTDRRGLREMSQAVELAAKQVPIRLVLAGPVHSGGKAEFLPQGDNELIECRGRLDHSQIPGLLSQAKIGLFLMHPMPNKLDALPIKLFEYMAAGLPVVISDIPLWRQMVQSAECGMLVDPLNPAAAAEALVWLLRHPAEAATMGRNGQRAVTENYNWERESQTLIAAYAELQSI